MPHHFIRRGEYNWDDPATLVDSLVAQIETRFPNQRDPEAGARIHPAARLDAALRRVSENELGPRGERLVVLIDGLDEYDAPEGSPTLDPLAAFLPHVLPGGVSVLCACRPRHPYKDMLDTRGAVPLDLDESSHKPDYETHYVLHRANGPRQSPATGARPPRSQSTYRVQLRRSCRGAC